mmetsp:Transcript_12088/g.36431  ORF Transcript_12088/g.36431 Transcript_12088/m.36431 type:complete len:320 (+) Transcript_12088:440-1399(+)
MDPEVLRGSACFGTCKLACLILFSTGFKVEEIRTNLAMITACQDNVFELKAGQLLNHADIHPICRMLPNLVALKLTYGVQKAGPHFDPVLFGIKISDAHCIARSLLCSESLTSLTLQSSLIDDDVIRLLIPGLLNNSHVTFIDMSHNKITNHGARLMSQVLEPNSTVGSLRLADNLIHTEGGRCFAHTLRATVALTELDLRLNRLLDSGGHLLLEAVSLSHTLQHINLSGNSLGTLSAKSAARTLILSKSLLSLDLSCNDFDDSDMELIRHSLQRSSGVETLDLRMNMATSLRDARPSCSLGARLQSEGQSRDSSSTIE